MIDKCPSCDYNFTYTMVEAANVISTAPDTAITGVQKGHSPKDGFCAKGTPPGTLQNMQRTVILRMLCIHGAKRSLRPVSFWT